MVTATLYSHLQNSLSAYITSMWDLSAKVRDFRKVSGNHGMGVIHDACHLLPSVWEGLTIASN